MQRGIAGNIGSGESNNPRASYPAFTPVLYEPNKPVGQRYTALKPSNIARMYHSTAVLTTNGTVLVSGCDSCANIKTDVTTWSASRWKQYEYRNEIFYPPDYFESEGDKVFPESINGLVGNGTAIPKVGICLLVQRAAVCASCLCSWSTWSCVNA